MKTNNKEIYLSVSILFLYVSWSIFWLLYSYFYLGSLESPYLPKSDITKELFVPMQSGHLLGTDLYGRDLLEVLSQGLLYSLSVGLLVSFFSCVIGILIGHFSLRPGVYGKALELVTNIVFIFPTIIVAILVMSFSENSFWGLVITLIVMGWPGYARIARNESARISGLSFVEGDYSIGYGPWRIFRKSILPSLMPIMFAHFTLGINSVIISEATLGFLGFGGSDYSWGALLNMSREVLLEAPHLTIILSLILSGLIIGINILGDGLREYFDPKKER